jgi:hypothetical protein
MGKKLGRGTNKDYMGNINLFSGTKIMTRKKEQKCSLQGTNHDYNRKKQKFCVCRTNHDYRGNNILGRETNKCYMRNKCLVKETNHDYKQNKEIFSSRYK